jgi:hypothetical protein
VACAANLTSLTVAEAKGCHDSGGPDKALARGWTQAQRIDMTARGRKVTIKRVAIATRWGAALNGQAQAYLSVRDPVDEGEPIDAEDKDAVSREHDLWRGGAVGENSFSRTLHRQS